MKIQWFRSLIMIKKGGRSSRASNFLNRGVPLLTLIRWTSCGSHGGKTVTRKLCSLTTKDLYNMNRPLIKGTISPFVKNYVEKKTGGSTIASCLNFFKQGTLLLFSWIRWTSYSEVRGSRRKNGDTKIVYFDESPAPYTLTPRRHRWYRSGWLGSRKPIAMIFN